MNKYNLIDILSNEIEIEVLDKLILYKFDGIQIPMIQRDYAQGRENELEVRTKFINAIFIALENNSNLELDFIYGSIKKIGNKQFFIPLDGQQRLTTLFLLYWYLGNREIEIVEDLRKSLSGFTYATRATARDFCEKLSKIKISYDKLPSKEIEEAGWFFSSLKKDPTVKSMLIMLDCIHEKYNNGKIKKEGNGEHYNLFANLSKLEFYILPLDGFDLSDELYIKMNARGKQLTDYENFKADLIDWLRADNNPYFNNFHNNIELKGRNMPYYLSFATKLDNVWTNLFWNYYSMFNEKQEDKIVDPYFVRFWNRYLLNIHITQSSLSQDSFEKNQLFQKLYGIKGIDGVIKYENFGNYKTLFEKEGVIFSIEKALDGLTENYSEIKEIIRPVWNQIDNWSLFDEKIVQNQRLLFYAVTRYLELNQFDSIKFKNWIRVVWNIIIDPDIRSIPVMCSIMRIIHKLSIGSEDIYKFLNNEVCQQIIHDEKSFTKSQLEEERLKAKLILSDILWEAEIINGEKHPLFLGNIGFLLLSNPTIEVFKSRLRIANQLFNGNGSNNEFLNNHKLIRALISNFDSWDELFKLDLGDNYNNWQLLLRRNPKVKEILCDFCDFDIEEQIRENIESFISLDSSICGTADNPEVLRRIEYIHKQLYSEEKLHIWMQQKGATKLKWRNSRIYIDRPGSWYDRVMIDTYRNELISQLIEKFNLNTTQRCTDSYYWGMAIELTKTFENFNITFVFDDFENLRIGIINDGKSAQIDNIDFDIDEVTEGWICRRKYNYNKIASEGDIHLLTQKIDQEIFDLSNSKSLISKIHTSLNVS